MAYSEETTCTPSYESWLPDWISHIPLTLPPSLKIPLSAGQISTPLNISTWHRHLVDYPNQDLARFFLAGVSNGFKVGFSNVSVNLKSARTNLHSVSLHPEVVDEYIQNELSLGRISGPYPLSQCPEVHTSRFGVIPKNHQPNKWRLIIDLSHPQGNSINDGIPQHLCSLSYVSVDDAILSILQSGKGTMLAKSILKAPFASFQCTEQIGISWQ